jgi:hypothetical protein
MGFSAEWDAIFGICHNVVDMIGFGVNSVGCHNHLLWSSIPHQTEGELTVTDLYRHFFGITGGVHTSM